jgi:hypothetical protein
MLSSPTVPTITHSQILEAIRVLGIDPASVQSLCVRRHYIEVTLMVIDEKGKRCAAGNDVATAVTKIPIVDNQFEGKIPVITPAGKQIAVDSGVA